MYSGIEIDSLTKTFRAHRWSGFRRHPLEVTAIAGITMSAPAGQAVAFIGPNGAGKSTTIKILTGILHPSSGHASVLGLVPWRDRQQLTYRIGAVFGQRSQLWYHLPPADTLELLARIYSLKRDEFVKTRAMLVERFDLGGFMNIPVRKLSLGQRMRAEIAASLIHRPQVLFLDEPTIGLDVIARQELRDLVREWNRTQGVTVFLTSHDSGDIEHVADRVVVINHGRIIFDDTVAAMRTRYLGAKILGITFQGPPPEIAIAGAEITHREGYVLKLRVDTRSTPVSRVVGELLKAAPVADIAVEDPPLDEVIVHIYNREEGGHGP